MMFSLVSAHNPTNIIITIQHFSRIFVLHPSIFMGQKIIR